MLTFQMLNELFSSCLSKRVRDIFAPIYMKGSGLFLPNLLKGLSYSCSIYLKKSELFHPIYPKGSKLFSSYLPVRVRAIFALFTPLFAPPPLPHPPLFLW